MGWVKSRLRTLLSGSSPGFTLMEVLVGVGILSITTSLIGGSLFQTLGISKGWQDDVIATKELRHAGSWFAGDALNTEGTDLIVDDPPVSSVTLSWIDSDDVSHNAVYSLSGSSLVRDLDGAQISVARRVVSVGFSLSGKTLTFDMEVDADQGTTESMSLQSYLRMLP